MARVPAVARDLQHRWSLTLGSPFDGEDVSCAWVAPATRPDGTAAVLKIAMPHMEGEQEIDGLRFWNGDPTVRLIDADEALGAMLLERCEPGTSLRSLPEEEQDVVIADLLRRAWRAADRPGRFRHLSEMVGYWTAETRAAESLWADAALVRDGLQLFADLSRSAADDVLLATDLHAGNVLRASRRPWIAIDPKPFVGDRAYDATQHLFNCRQRMIGSPIETINRFADLLEVDRDRVRLWIFARAAAEPRHEWQDWRTHLARHRLA